MTILIVEDEELAVKKLQKTLNAVERSADIVGITGSIEATVEWLESHPAPDLILMDIELSDGQSFEIFSRTRIKSPVIFTTSYDEYALRAFKVNSIDYLLKPVQKEDLEAALAKFAELKTIYHGEEAVVAESPAPLDMDSLLQELRSKLQPRDFRRRFLVKNAQKLVSIEVEDIAFFFSDGRLNFFKSRDGKKFVVDYTMDELEEMLDPQRWFRISRSFYVSIGAVDQIHEYFGNRLLLQLRPDVDKEAIVSREKVSDFKRWMGK